jgi:hypothetical protein
MKNIKNIIRICIITTLAGGLAYILGYTPFVSIYRQPSIIQKIAVQSGQATTGIYISSSTYRKPILQQRMEYYQASKKELLGRGE